MYTYSPHKMDSMNNRSPRSSRGIMDPRPTPLKVRGDSHKIIKNEPFGSPLLPQPPPIHHQEPSLSHPPRGHIVISYKIIHTHRDDFKALVQRLTGKPSTSTDSSSFSTSSLAASNASCGMISPGARFAATEKANTSNKVGIFVGDVGTMNQYYNHQQHQHHPIERPSFHHAGNFSPVPTSMPLISPDFFSTAGPTKPQDFSSFFERPSFHHAGNFSPGPTSLPLISPDFFSTPGPTEPQDFLCFSERPSFHHAGNFSPGPTSLPLISPDFFSTAGPQDFLSFSDDSSSTLQNSRSTIQPSSMDDFDNFFDS